MSQSQFDPMAKRNELLGSTGYEWSLAHDFARAKAVGGLGSSARADLYTAIECFLVGFDEPAQRLLKLALEWVDISIASGERPERYFPAGTEASCFQTKALCSWLLLNLHDADSFHHFVEHEDQYLTDPRVGTDKVEVSFVLPTYVDAGAFERVLEISGDVPRLSPPTSSTARGEAAMAYVVSRYRLGLQYSRTEFKAIADRFLKMHVDKWLANGHSVRAAEWMKIVHWNDAEQPISAKQALLKCYDYLPGREPPL